MADDPWPITLPPINLHTVKPAYLLITYAPGPSTMTAENVEAWKKSVDLATWEAWRQTMTLSIVRSQRRMN